MSALATLEEAQAAGLWFVNDRQPGFTRRKFGRGFAYFDREGRRIENRETLARIKSLAIPPAWKEVWISPHPRGYLQATGRDAKGRKQAIYHADWACHRDETKFARMRCFGEALPHLRQQIEADLRRHGLPKAKVVAAIVRLLETTLIRVGTARYVRENGSFGLTTLRNAHADVGASKIRFKFKGKSGKFHDIALTDRRLAGIVRRCQELPGQSLFQYLGEDGEPGEVTSEDVNAYLREATGDDFTAKDFRTWVATVETIRLVRERRPETKSGYDAIVKTVARLLGNTATVCRNSYIYPGALQRQPTPEWVTCRLPVLRRQGIAPIEYLALKYVFV